MVFPGLGFTDMDPLTIDQLMAWRRRAERRAPRDKSQGKGRRG